MKKTMLATSLTVLMTATLALSPAQAAPGLDKKRDKGTTAPVIVDRYEAPESATASVTTQSNALAASCVADPITDPNMRTTSCYNGATYTAVSSKLVQYDAKPMTNQTFLISVAKGQTMTLSNEVTVSETVEVSTTVESGILDVINFKLTTTYTGTVSRKYNTTTQYSGPDSSSPYNSRSFFSGAIFDLYDVTVNKKGHYTKYVDVYNNGVYSYSYNYNYDQDLGNTVHKAYKPIIVTYSIDSLYY